MNRSRFDIRSSLFLLGALLAAGCDRPDPARQTGTEAPAAAASIDTTRFVASGMIPEMIVRETTVKAPVRDVFEQLTTTTGIERALNLPALVDLRIGGPYHIFFDTKADTGNQGSEGSQILSYVPNRMLSFSWNAPPRFAEERKYRTWVVITFDPIGENQTFVRLTHLGFGKGPKWAEFKQWSDASWAGLLKRLGEHFGGIQLPKAPGAPATQPR
jgi:uncharacterized protein YndB with AHSA1/START domain